MKIIYKSFFSDKIIFRQLLILLILFIILYLSGTFKLYIDNSIYLINNNIDNRTIIVVFNEGYDENNLDMNLIEKVEKLEDGVRYKIILKKNNFLDEFMTKNPEYYANIEINNQKSGEDTILTFFQNFLNIAIVVISAFVFFVIIINIFEMFLNEKKEISLYKLLGFTNFSIIKYFGIILFFIYFIIIVSSFLFYSVIIIIFNLLVFSIKLNLISLLSFFVIFGIVFVVILLLLIILYLKLRKITPIYFQMEVD